MTEGDGPKYKSEDVSKQETSDPNKRGKAQLFVADAPKKPALGGKGLDSNAVYEAQSGMSCFSC